MKTASDATVQVLVFSLVAAAFTTVYITQPVLPIIQDEFGVNARGAAGITGYGYAYTSRGWFGAAVLGIAVISLPLTIGLLEITRDRRENR